MATYYIDFDAGDDTAAGTQVAPWKTIPGTRNTASTDWQSTDWGGGTINSANEVPKGTIFRLKSGATHDSTNGGNILLDSTYYDTDGDAANKISFIRDPTWGTGQITFDGTGITLAGSGSGIFRIKVNGISIDGSVAKGIMVQNATHCGIAESRASDGVGPWIYRCEFYGNGTAYSASESASNGQIRISRSTGGTIDTCYMNGNAMMVQGVSLSDSALRCIDFTVVDCEAFNLAGTDDGGIGFKAQNSQVTFTRCESYDNYKGFDCGEISANDSWDISYTLVNCKGYDNDISGLGLSGLGNLVGTYAGAITWRVINCIWRDNGWTGMKVYSGPYTLYLVGCLFDNNGNVAGESNISIYPSEHNDETEIRFYYYNNIFYKPSGTANIVNAKLGDGTLGYVSDFNWYGDYNSFVQTGAEKFCEWSYYANANRAAPVSYSYGGDGPGQTLGNWYTDDDVPGAAIGHQGCDEHSKGTGCADATEPPFADVANQNYALTVSYAGIDISGEVWYTAEMGLDMAGVTRTAWDIGPYEYVSGGYVRFY